MSNNTLVALCLLVMLAIVVACQPEQLVTPLPAATEGVSGKQVTMPAVASPQPTDTAVAEPTPPPTPLPAPTPISSPAAPRVVFDDGGRLFSLEMPPSGVDSQAQPRQLTASGMDQAVEVSPDGQRVLFLRVYENWEAELWSVNLDGGEETMLVSPAQLPTQKGENLAGEATVITRSPYAAAWLADSRTVALNTQWNHEYGLVLADDLWLVDSDTRALTQPLPDGQGGQFAFSPDGEWILLATAGGFGSGGPQTDGEVVMLRTDTTERRVVTTFSVISTSSEYLFYPTPLWLPDSSGARILIPSADPWLWDANGALWAIRTDGGSGVELGRIPGNYLFQDQVWSPGFDRTAYVARTGDPASNEGELYIADGSGAGARMVHTAEYLEFLGWSPDNVRFLFYAGNPPTLFLGELDRPPRAIVAGDTGTALRDVEWLDAQRFLYLTGSYGAWELMLSHVGGTGTSLASPAGDFPTYVVSAQKR